MVSNYEVLMQVNDNVTKLNKKNLKNFINTVTKWKSGL